MSARPVSNASPEAEEARPSSGDARPAGAGLIGAPSSPAANDPDEPPGPAGPSNLIKRTADEIYGLMAQVHDIREDLLAHGVQFHMLNALIEMGVHDKPDEQAKMIVTAVEASVKAHGPQAIERQELVHHLDELVVLEKDLRHVRHVAAQQGVHMQALNHLTQLMRLNPGDRGTHAVNMLVAYAEAAGIDLSASRAVLDGIEQENASVLPDIDRSALHPDRSAIRLFARHVAIGLALTVLMFWVVL